MKTITLQHTLMRFVWIVEIVFLLFLYYDLPHAYDSAILQLLLLGIVANIFIFIKLSRKQNKAFRHTSVISYLFLLSYCIVFFQKYADLSIRLANEGDPVFGFPQSIIHCCLISFVGLLAYFVGYLGNRHEKRQGKKKTVIIQTERLNTILIISTILYIYYNIQNVYLERSQELLEAQSGSMVLYSRILYSIISNLYISYKVFQLKDRKVPMSFQKYMSEIGSVCNICLLAYILLTLLSGGRAGIISKLLFYLGGYLLCARKKFSKVTLAVLLVVSVMLMSALGQARKLDRQQSFIERLATGRAMAEEVKSISPFTNELAGSVNTLQYSEYYVPSTHPYLYGYFQLKQVFSSIPFFNHIVYQFTDNSRMYTSSAFFITWLIQGDNYTYGSGSSCNADLYLSFGIWGVLLGLLIWGCVIRKTENVWVNGPTSTVQIICLLTLFSESVFVCRDSLLCFVNVLMFTLIFDYLYRKFLTKNNIVSIKKNEKI